MNLYDMLRRNDRNLEVSGDVAMARRKVADQLWRGLYLAAGSSFRILDVRRFINFRSWPDSCGWMVETPDGLALKLSFVRRGTDETLGSGKFSGDFQLTYLPWPKQCGGGAMDLLVEAEGKSREPLFLANHRALSRQWLFDLAIGKGIEIGPGPSPQILPRPGVDISYLEQMPPKEWNELYNRGGKYPVRPELWDNYIVGEASNLPVADGSLDFLFGSHVFEHLSNPIGHLKHWRTKLKPGGKVFCVVPDLHGTKDAIQQTSTMAEWQSELACDIWLPTESHYMRHLQRPAGHPAVTAAMDRRESIHVHFYDNINCQLLLEHAVRELGYEDFVIEHTPNHKDFHFVLVNR